MRGLPIFVPAADGPIQYPSVFSADGSRFGAGPGDQPGVYSRICFHGIALTVLCPPVSQRGAPRPALTEGFCFQASTYLHNTQIFVMLSRNRINRVSGLFYRTITPCASDFHGSLTIANNVNLRPITKVTCGAWRPIVTTAMRLAYTSEVCAVECISVFWSHPFCCCRFSPPLNPCRGYRLL